MVDGLERRDRLVVDVGCGLGGPARVLARDYGARVVGLDLEAPLLERARDRARAEGLAGRVTFQQVEKGPLPFEDASVDVVLSAGAYTQTEDKLGAFRDCWRVLRSGGAITLYDWTRRDAELSEDMRYWIQVEGLTYALETLDRYAELLEQTGFVDVRVEDASGWYRRRVAEEYDAIRGPLFPRMLERMGRQNAEHFVENWRAMLRVCETGEMRQGYCRGRKP
jgi:cyclopropane fatty-acyl-phospholipid synthase-like methyltransferase